MARPPRKPRVPGPAPAGVGARRPLVAPGGALAGFEFHAGASGRHQLRRLEDEVTTRAVAANVLGAMRLCVSQGGVALAEFPPVWLARCGDEAFCRGMYLTLCADALFEDAAGMSRLLARLRATGALVGWRVPEGDLPVPPGNPDFVLLQQPPRTGRATWRRAGMDAAARWPGVPQVMLDLPDVNVMELLLQAPVVLAACQIGDEAAPAPMQALSPQARHLMKLLHRLVRDDDNALLIADIKADAALGLRLLQYLNSAGATPGRQLDSVDQAVMVLGRDALYRWVAQMMVRLSPPRGAAAALQSMALARARLFELMARSVDDPAAGRLYLLGLVSMLPLLMGCSLEDAVESLNLPPEALEALAFGRGPWQAYLAVAQALDRQQMAALQELAVPFKGLEAVLALSVRAWLP